MKMNFCRAFNNGVSKFLLHDFYCSAVLPKRNTFIVKRKLQVPLSRTRAERPRILKGRHFIYETVEDTDLTPPPDIQVVLTDFVEGIGDVGDVISAEANYARYSLLLLKKAVYATPENIQKYASIKELRPEGPKASSIYATMTVRCLSKTVIPVYMNHEVPWTVEKVHIQIAFRNEGFFVPFDAIELPLSSIEGPDSTKEAKDFAIHITINNAERVPVRCKLFHIKPGFETSKLSMEYYTEKGEPILDDQRELLEGMPKPEIFDPDQNVSLVEKHRIQYIK